MTFREKWKLNLRGYKEIHRLAPGLIATNIGKALFSSLLPFVNIVLSARIVTALAEGAGLRQVLFLAALTAALNVMFSLGASGLEKLQAFHNNKFWIVCELPLYEKIRRMDYEKVEDAETHQSYLHLRTLRQSSGFGLDRLLFCQEWLISGCVTAAASVFLLGGAFTTRYSGDPGIWGFLFSPLTALPVAAGILLNVLFSVRCARENTRKATQAMVSLQKVNRIYYYYMEHILYNYTGGKDIKLYRLNRPLLKANGEIMDILNSTLKKFWKVSGRYEAAMAVVNTLMTGIIYGYVALKALFGSFGVGNIIQYAGALSKLGGGVSQIMTQLSMLDANVPALELYFAFTDQPDRMYQGTLPVEKRQDNEYEIEFRDVSFRYPGREEYALKHLNLKFTIGKRLAVVGRNGSGKTTMIKLLCRLYDPTEGQITLNGVDIRKYDYLEYLSVFSVVFQDFKLFSFGLGQNVAASVSYDREKAEDCLKKAGFGERLKELPKGLETALYKDFEEDGVEISGGEAQKIALARALYKDAPFIILDEPTAALDPVAEYEVYSRFNEIVGEKTAVYISHRLSSCRFCDDIAVFDGGELVQRGSHDTLVAQEDGVYSRLWNAQAQYYREEK